MAYRNYGAAYGGIIAAPRAVNAGSNGDYPDLVAAMTTSGAGQNFNQVYYLNEGTYANQDFTMPPGVTITSFPGSEVGAATTTGTITINQAGTYVISGIRLVAVGAYAIEITGSAVIYLHLEECNLLAQTFTAIHNSNPNATIYFNNCTGNIANGTASIILQDNGAAIFNYCLFTNTGLSTGFNAFNNGYLETNFCEFDNSFSTSGTCFSILYYTDINTGPLNQVSFLHGSTFTSPSPLDHCILSSGTAPCITLNSNTFLSTNFSVISSTNVNTVSGTGNFEYNIINMNETFNIQNTLTISGDVARIYKLIIGSIGSLEMETGTTLQIDSGATVEVESGAVLQVDAGATTRLPLSGVLIGHGAGNAVTASAMTTNGQLLIGGASGPLAATLTAGSGVSISNAANSITISASSGGFTWNNTTGTSATLVAQNGYQANNAGLVTFTLPTTASSNFGDTIKIMGLGAGGWAISQAASQQIIVGSASSTSGAGGSVASTNRYDAITLVYSSTSGTWRATSFVGVLNIT